jgi:hypothetical protein
VDEREYSLDDSKIPATLTLCDDVLVGRKTLRLKRSTALAWTSAGAVRGAGETCYLQDLEN